MSAWSPQFLFAACQCGAEAALKAELAERAPNLRPSFSRPGFVTFKFDSPCDSPAGFQLRSVFARSWGFSVGKTTGDNATQLAAASWALPGVAEVLANHPIRDLHVWERDRVVPGDDGFEPGPTPLAAEVDAALRAAAPLESLRTSSYAERGASQPNVWVLDAVIVEPGEWWLGCHFTARRTACWVGGVPPLELPDYAVSRAYLKMAEALEWSSLPMARGEVCVELGCAPGGAAQALLDAGLTVIGIDPAEVDPSVAEHPHFVHVRRRSLDVPKHDLQHARWLAADMNVAPAYTLDAVEDVVLHKSHTIRGLVLTLKLADWSLAAQLGQFVARVRGWGYRDIRVRQLAFNRQELCLVALRSRAQRRVMRPPARQYLRTDGPHGPLPGGMHGEVY
jgi:23S rRNA (cytidine2498-2'-O)-methyltransferase